MGTRGLIGVVIDGAEKFAYNHWDSYPNSLGVEVVSFCKNVNSKSWTKFKKLAKKVRLVSDDGEKPTLAEQKKYEQYFDDNVSTGKKDEWYCLLRGLQGVKTLEAMLYDGVDVLIDYADFMTSRCGCEYAYIINLDTGMLEFYDGDGKRGEAPYKDVPDDWQKKFFTYDDE